MKEKAKALAVTAGAAALALLLATPSFAQSRGEWNRNGSNDRRGSSRQGDRSNERNGDQRSERNGDQRNGRSSSSYRDNQRVSMDGKISSYSRERDGYRVRLDNDRSSYYVPQSYFRGRNDVRVGLSVRLGGIFRGGTIYVDAVDWGNRGNDRYGTYERGANNAYLRGTVERVDYRNNTLWVQDDYSRRVVAVDMRNTDGRGRVDLNDLRRGDYVELSGESYGGNFVAYNIDNVRTR